MYRAATLIELLTTLAVSLILLSLFSPAVFRLADPIAVQREAEQLQTFFAQIQADARYQRRNYALMVSQEKGRWCAIAMAKNGAKQSACNCLNLSVCRLDTPYRLYHSHYATEIVPSKFYPAVLTYLDGSSGNNAGGCVRIVKGTAWLILQFQQLGVVNVIQSKTRSNCGK